MAASNYITGELLDRLGISPRVVTIGIGVLFMLPGIIWFITYNWWDRERIVSSRTQSEDERDVFAKESSSS